MSFARNIPPPYFAVIFASQLSEKVEGYEDTALRMVELAAQQKGYLGHESTRDGNGFGITISYWDSLEAIKNWRNHAEHSLARERGRTEFYQHFELRIAEVTRTYAGGLDTKHDL